MSLHFIQSLVGLVVLVWLIVENAIDKNKIIELNKEIEKYKNGDKK